MNQISTEILALSGEPALLARHFRVFFANAAARQLLGDHCEGRLLEELLGPALCETQAPAFLLDQTIRGHRYTLRVNHIDDCQLIFLRRCGSAPLPLNDALLYSLRSALMNLSASAELLRARAGEQGDGLLLQALRSVTHCYYRLLRLLTNASLVLSVTDGSAPFAPEEMDMVPFLSGLLDTVGMLCPGIVFSLSHGEIHPIVADRQMVELMVLNLISNCTVHASGCTRVHLHLMETRENLVLSVDDDGCGIPPEQLGMVFDRYCHGFDVGSLLSGAGLGLTVARSVAQLHQGTLLLESRQDKGTTVRVSLSRRLSGARRSGVPGAWESGMQGILTALAGSLPDACYTERYLD